MRLRRRTSILSMESRAAIASSSRSRTKVLSKRPGARYQHVLGIKLAANAEAAADMALDQMHARAGAAKHAGDVVPIPVRHLGGAVKLKHVTSGVVAGDRAARLERNTGMPPDGEV